MREHRQVSDPIFAHETWRTINRLLTPNTWVDVAQQRKSLSDYFLNIGFLGIHAGCILVLWSGASWVAVGVAAFLYFIRMFGLTAGYHRYFSHRSFKTSRAFQFVLAVLGASAVQNSPLWWASHHRHHHRHSDTEEDVHSPITNTFYWAHMGWILSKKYNYTEYKLVPDLAKFRELHWLTSYYLVVPISLGVGLFGLGELLGSAWNTSGFQMLVWGFFISTTVLYHGTFTVNSLAHKWGSRRFKTTDQSRNNLFIALITLGEGWHNNHHRYLSSERQGFYWWEVDISHYMLKMLSWVGIVWDLKTPPKTIYDEANGLAHPHHIRLADRGPVRRIEELEEELDEIEA
jgi:stearoyl-CoA desaturase (delta-9 desaturase)